MRSFLFRPTRSLGFNVASQEDAPRSSAAVEHQPLIIFSVSALKWHLPFLFFDPTHSAHLVSRRITDIPLEGPLKRRSRILQGLTSSQWDGCLNSNDSVGFQKVDLTFALKCHTLEFRARAIDHAVNFQPVECLSCTHFGARFT